MTRMPLALHRRLRVRADDMLSDFRPPASTGCGGCGSMVTVGRRCCGRWFHAGACVNDHTREAHPDWWARFAAELRGEGA